MKDVSMSTTAVLISDPFDPQSWEVGKKEKPRASPGHVVVHVTLRPINPTDTLSPTLFFGHLKDKHPVTGADGVGYVEEVGEGVTKVKVGQRVVPSFQRLFYIKGEGSWQDYVEVRENELHFIPDSISDEVASQTVINPWTAFGMLTDQHVPKGEYLLQNAAGSALGRMIIQLAKHWGIKLINVVRRDAVKEELKSLGADEVINSTTEDLLARVMEITGGKGVAGALDPVAGIGTKQIVATVKDGGKVFLYGALGAPDQDATISLGDFGRVEIKFWVLHLSLVLKTDEELQEISTAVGKLLEEKVFVLKSAVKTFNLVDFKEALAEAERSGSSGKGKVLLAS